MTEDTQDIPTEVRDKIREEAERYLNIYRPVHGHLVLDDQYMKQIRASLEYGLLTRILNEVESADVDYLNELVRRLGESVTVDTQFRLSELSSAISGINNRLSNLNIQAIKDSIVAEVYTRFDSDSSAANLRLEALEKAIGKLTITPESITKDFRLQLESATEGIISRVSTLEQYNLTKTADDILLASKVSQLEALYEDSNKRLLARISEVNQSRINGHEAVSEQIVSLISQVNNSKATADEVKSTYASLEQAYSERISTLESSVRQNDIDIKAKLSEQSRTLTEANQAIAQKVTNLETNVDGKIGSKFNEAIETMSTNQEAIARRVTELNSSFLGLEGKLEGSIKEEIKSISDANKVHLSKIEQLEANTETTLAEIESVKESIVTPEQVTNIVSEEMVAKYTNIKDKILDTRDTNEYPGYYYTNYPNTLAKEIKLASVIGIDGEGDLGYMETQTIGTNYREGKVTQVFYCEDGDTYKRVSISEDIWNVWKLQETDESAKEKLRLALLEVQQKIVESEARIETYNRTHTDAIKALADSYKQLEADYKEGDRVVNSRILTQEQVQSTVDTANAATLTVLNSSIEDVKGSIKRLQETVTNPDGSVAISEEIIRGLILDETKIKDTKTVNNTPEWYITNHLNKQVQELKTTSILSITGTGDVFLQTHVTGSSVSRGSVKQEAYTEANKTYTRYSTGLSKWSTWVEIETAVGSANKVRLAKEALERELARVYGEFVDYKELKVEQDGVVAQRLDGIATKLSTDYGTLTGRIQREEEVRLANDSSLSRRIDNINSTLGTNYATITMVNEAKTTLEGSIVTKADELTSGFDNRIKEEKLIIAQDIKTSSDGVKSELTEKLKQYREQVTKATSDFNDYKRLNDSAVASLGIRNTELKSEFTQDIKLAKEQLITKINDISIGGRNLLRDTGVVDGYGTFNAKGAFTTHDGYVRVQSTVSGNMGIHVKNHYGHTIKNGEQAVLSFQYRTNALNLDYTYLLSPSGHWDITPKISGFIGDGEWRYAVLPFTVPRDLADVRALIGCTNAAVGTYIEVRKVKLEIGNKATDWTVAPEDLDKTIESVKIVASKAASDIQRIDKVVNDATKASAEETKRINAKFTSTEELITTKTDKALQDAKGYADAEILKVDRRVTETNAGIERNEAAQALKNSAFAEAVSTLSASLANKIDGTQVDAKIQVEKDARVDGIQALAKQITKGSVKFPNGTGNTNEVSSVLNDIIKATADSTFVDKSSTLKATLHREVDEKMFRDAGNLLTDTINYTSWEASKHSGESILPRVNDGIWDLSGTTTNWKEIRIFSKEGTRLENSKSAESLVQVTEGSEYILEFEAKGNVELDVFIRTYYKVGSNNRNKQINSKVSLQGTWTKHRVQVKCPELEANEIRDYIGVFFYSASVGSAQIRKPRLYLDPSVLNAAIKEYKQMNLDMKNNLDAKIGLTVDSGNRIIGWTATERNNSSEFNIMADKFKISNSTRTATPFSIDSSGNAIFNGKVSFSNVQNPPTIPKVPITITAVGVSNHLDASKRFTLLTTDTRDLHRVNSGRGIWLSVVNPTTGELISNNRYDTYTTAGCTAFKAAVDGLNRGSNLIVVRSWDASLANNNDLITALNTLSPTFGTNVNKSLTSLVNTSFCLISQITGNNRYEASAIDGRKSPDQGEAMCSGSLFNGIFTPTSSPTNISQTNLVEIAKAEADKKDAAINAVGSRIDSLAVGGRNYLTKASFGTWQNGTWQDYRFVINDKSSAGAAFTRAEAIEQGADVVFSFKIAKKSGRITSIGGHTHSLSHHQIYIDGILAGSDFNAGVAYPDDLAVHHIVIKAKDHYATGSNDKALYIQPNRGSNGYADVYSCEIWDCKLERGTVPTDWTPAPEDIDSSIANAKQQTDELRTNLGNLDIAIKGSFKDGIIEEAEAKSIEKYINILNKERDELNNAFSGIYKLGIIKGSDAERPYNDVKTGYLTANSQLINSINTAIRDGKTTQSEKADVDAKFSNYNSKLNNAKQLLNDLNIKATEEANNLANTVNTKIDNLSVGGRNLLKDSKPNVTNSNYSHRFALTEAPNVGDEVTVTLWGNMANDRQGIGVYNSHGYTELLRLVKVSEGVYRGTGTWALPRNGNTVLTPNNTHLNVYFYPSSATSNNTINKIKLEYGNKGTDWSPAPEDVDSSITTAKTEAITEARQTTVLTTTQDLNTLVKSGTYFIKASNNTNSPISNWLYVSVEGDETDRILQTVTQDSNDSIRYTRRKHGNTWTNWTKVVNEADVNNIVNNLKIPHILTAQGSHHNNNAWMKINSHTGSRALTYTASEGIVVQVLNQATLVVELTAVYPKTSAGYLNMKNALSSASTNRIAMIVSRTNLPITNDNNLRDALRIAGSTDLIYETLYRRTNTTFALIGRVGVAGSAYESIVDTGSDMYGNYASVSALWDSGELLPSNQTLINGGRIVTNSITALQIAANSITANEINTDAILTKHIKAGSVGTNEIAANAINANHINTNSINTNHIQAKSINADKIADSTITNAKIYNGTIEGSKLKDATITNSKIGLAAIKSANIEDGAITSAKIGDAQIDNAKIANGAITTAKIGTAQVDTLQIAGEAVITPRYQYTDWHNARQPGVWHTMFQFTMNTQGGSAVLLFGWTSILMAGWHASSVNGEVRIQRDGHVLFSQTFSSQSAWYTGPGNYASPPIFDFNPPPNAVYQVLIIYHGDRPEVRVTGARLLGMGMKR